MAAIIYWQAKEISRIVKEYNPEEADIDISLLSHISPIEWSNVILYGEYKLNRDLVRRKFLSVHVRRNRGSTLISGIKW